MKTYIVKYSVHFTDRLPKHGKMKIKNCMSELHAKVKLESFLKKKNSSFSNLIVHNCDEDFFNIFGDIFK